MTKKKICVCGHFGFGFVKLNGQTIKTKILYSTLQQIYGDEAITHIDTCGGLKALLKLPYQLLKAVRHSENLIILPAYKGLCVISVILAFYRLFSKKCRVHYVVIGGWLVAYMKTKFFLEHSIRMGIDYIYCETTTMKRRLEGLNFYNIIVMPNFKELPIVDRHDLRKSTTNPILLCTFSRVAYQKGIDDIVDVVTQINSSLNIPAFKLHIYGPIAPVEQQWFKRLKSKFTSEIEYCGEVASNESVAVLSKYDVLVFPTHHFTEGVPGTIIDAYASGVPVISAKWESCLDVVSDCETGFVYPFNDVQALMDVLLKINSNPSILYSMRLHCVNRAVDFLPKNVVHSCLLLK